ncbi:uncharacterized protein LOC119663604 [Teleopsis dalmanni]|uniref:uncharacterized protein LOC119663604 n=1 Tax=Teleopsis dalmanni TaxID=139649 RepID=UPI0018CF3EAD|nr:uncharacterized protein LOC119663604 [Teleopsis dalmanni]
MQKVDEDSRNKWKESLNFETLPKWEDCANLLDRHCQFLESIGNENRPRNQMRHKTNAQNNSNVRSKQYIFSVAISNRSCFMCSSLEHSITKYSMFKSLMVEQRFNKVKELGLCINCLSQGHRANNCPSMHRCKECAGRHHTLLHRLQLKNHQITTVSRTPSSELPVASHNHQTISAAQEVILATALVLVKDCLGNYQIGRALLDSCSQVNFVTEDFTERLKLPKYKKPLYVSSIGDSRTNISQQTTARIKSRHSNYWT